MVTVYAVSVCVRPVGLVMIVAAKMIRRTALLVMIRQSALDTENVSAISAFAIRKVAFSENSATSVRYGFFLSHLNICRIITCITE